MLRKRNPPAAASLFVLSLSALLVSQSSQAGIWLQGTGMSSGIKDSNGSNQIRSFYTSTAAYSLIQGLELGGEYIQTQNSTQDKSTGYGPKVGFLMSGFEASFSYLLSSTRNFGADNYSGGGYAINLGYAPYLVRPIRLGITLTYAQFLLQKKNGTSITPADKVTAWSPMISLGLDF